MVVQSCECTKTHRITHFKVVNFMVRELYLNLKVKKNKERKKEATTENKANLCYVA